MAREGWLTAEDFIAAARTVMGDMVAVPPETAAFKRRLRKTIHDAGIETVFEVAEVCTWVMTWAKHAVTVDTLAFKAGTWLARARAEADRPAGASKRGAPLEME